MPAGVGQQDMGISGVVAGLYEAGAVEVTEVTLVGYDLTSVSG
jgi:hypothetical protein